MNVSAGACYEDLHHIAQTDTQLSEDEGEKRKKKKKSQNGIDLPENGWKASRERCCGPCQVLRGMLQMVPGDATGEEISELPAVPINWGLSWGNEGKLF